MPGEPSWVQIGRDQFTGTDLSTVDGRLFDDGSGRSWTVMKGAAVVQDGRIRIAGTVPERMVARVNMGVWPARADGKVQVELKADEPNRVALFGRMNEDATSYYLAYYDSPYVHLFSVVSGLSTWLGKASLAPGFPGQIFALECVANKIRVRRGGTLALEVIDASILSAGYWGIEITSPAQYIDDFRFYLDEVVASTTPPTTITPTTAAPTTVAATTIGPTTTAPTTPAEPTFPPSTVAPTTDAPTTLGPTTAGPTTPAPTTLPPATLEPVLLGNSIRTNVAYVSERDQLVVRAWVVNSDQRTRTVALDPSVCELRLIDEAGVTRTVIGTDDHDPYVVRFVVSSARLYAEHLYLLRVVLDDVGPKYSAVPVI